MQVPRQPSDISRQTQNAIAPFAWASTALLWTASWAEILSKGRWQSPDDFSSMYLGIMAGYAGIAEISKWLKNAPTNPDEDPALERIHRGAFFIWLWLAPLTCAYVWRFFNHGIPMPPALKKIAGGLIAIFFVKGTSRHLRHKKNGVALDIETGSEGEAASEDVDFVEVVYQRVASASDGLTAGDLQDAFPDTPRIRLYRTLHKLVASRRLARSGAPRTTAVKYRAAPTRA
jgi:hypothetical protein